jgi:LPS O-antigen subunit length determinant protein (WzzB/FepE family)
MLQTDPKKPTGQSEFVGLSLTYPEGVAGVDVVNGLVAFVLEAERARIDADLKVLVTNRLLNIEQKIDAARANYAASKEAQIALLLEQDSLTRAHLRDELQALRDELKTRRQSRIAVLDEAIQIAESLGIQNPTTPSSMSDSQRQGQVVRTEVNSREIPLYFMGSAALKAEREALRTRSSDDFIEPRISEIEKELAMLERNRHVEILEKRQNEDLYLDDLAEWREEAAQLRGVKFDTSQLQLVRLDQLALEPLAAVKPKKLLIIAIGGVLGLMMGVFVALLRNFMRPKNTTSHSSTATLGRVRRVASTR